MTPDDFPAHHPEWVQRDHMLIAWAMIHGGMIFDSGDRIPARKRRPSVSLSYEDAEWIEVSLDPFGLPILTPELRQRLGDEWRKWKDANNDNPRSP